MSFVILFMVFMLIVMVALIGLVLKEFSRQFAVMALHMERLQAKIEKIECPVMHDHSIDDIRSK